MRHLARLSKELKFKVPAIFNKWINVKRPFAAQQGRKAPGMAGYNARKGVRGCEWGLTRKQTCAAC